jgi:hypothetical protein
MECLHICNFPSKYITLDLFKLFIYLLSQTCPLQGLVILQHFNNVLKVKCEQNVEQSLIWCCDCIVTHCDDQTLCYNVITTYCQ